MELVEVDGNLRHTKKRWHVERVVVRSGSRDFFILSVPRLRTPYRGSFTLILVRDLLSNALPDSLRPCPPSDP